MCVKDEALEPGREPLCLFPSVLVPDMYDIQRDCAGYSAEAAEPTRLRD